MASKKTKTATTQAPKLKGGKAKEFPHVAEALEKPLGEPTPQPAVKPVEDGPAAQKEAHKGVKAGTKAKTKESKPKKVGALDAAARVLEEAGKPMNCKDMIDTMADKGYWSSPNGQTPHATLHTAVTMLPNCAPRRGLSKRAG
jgi:hypothetical protein